MLRFFFSLFLLSVPAYGQSLAGGNSNAPIEINADRLEVVQSDQKAIFSGNVEATQDKIKLNSDRMTVFYRPAGEEGGQSGVSRIEVAGNVKMNTPTESASGDQGVYNVDNKQILMFGNVLLRRDKNVLNGQRLEYNLETGRSLLTSGDAGAPVGNEGSTGRVKGVFIPKAKE